MRKFLSILFVLALGVLPTVGWTQEQAEADEEKDALEVSFSAGLGMPLDGVKTWNDSMGAKNGFSGSFHAGYFLTSNVVVGAMFTYSRFGIGTSNPTHTQKHQLYYPGAYVKYHFFGSSDLVPFIEANIGADFVKFSTLMYDGAIPKFREAGYTPGLGAGMAAGLHYYTSDMGGLFLQVGYHHGFTENQTKLYGGHEYTFGENLNMFSVNAGIQVFFGSGQ